MADYIEQAGVKAHFNALLTGRPTTRRVRRKTLADAFVEARRGLTSDQRIDYLCRSFNYGSRKNSVN